MFISDLHLNSAQDSAYRGLETLIDAEIENIDELYILGDLCEAWVGDDDDSDFVTKLTALLNKASSRCAVFFMHGNRDFLIGEAFASASNVTLLTDPCLIDDHLLLSHGDQYCTDDVDYMNMRQMLRSPDWQKSILEQPLSVRRDMAADLREQSIAAGANKAENITDVNAEAVLDSMASFGADTLIHGHTHRPGIHRVINIGQRLVLGDWGHCGWLLRQTSNSFQLECLPLN